MCIYLLTLVIHELLCLRCQTMKLLADFRARVLSAKVKKAAEQEEQEEEEEEGEKEVIQEPVEQPSGTEQPTVYNEDW